MYLIYLPCLFSFNNIHIVLRIDENISSEEMEVNNLTETFKLEVTKLEQESRKSDFRVHILNYYFYCIFDTYINYSLNE